MNICIVGFGYWGKIIYENLIRLGYRNIDICEIDESQIKNYQFTCRKIHIIKDYKDVKCTHLFITTPASTHFDICQELAPKIRNIFCEKPLTRTLKEHDILNKIFDSYNTNVLVDWTFHYNKGVEYLYDYIIKNGPPKNIIMNRLNYGPIRYDVDARLDLASHDVSILHKILKQKLVSSEWINFRRNKNSQRNDSTVGILQFSETSVQVNASWEFGQKDRKCYFDFENEMMIWDDIKKTITTNNNIVSVANLPLQIAIIEFMSRRNYNSNKEMNTTRKIMEMLDDKI